MAVSLPSPPPAAPVTATGPEPAPRRSSPGRALLAVLLLAALYAAFDGGATGRVELARLQAVLAVAGLAAAAGWLGARRLRPGAAPATLAGLAALAALAVWTGASLSWSVVPDRSWAELNRLLAYLVAAGSAVVVGAALPRANARTAAGALAACVLVALWALAGKVVPGVVGHALTDPRLRAPLDDPNALGLLCAMGAVLGVRLAAQPDGRRAGRAGALVALALLLCTLGMTYSRGAVLALVAGLVVVTALRGPRLRGLAALALAAAGTAPVLALVFSVPELSEPGITRDERVEAGLLLGVVLLAMVVLLAAAGRFLLGREARRADRPARERPTWLALAALVVALAVAGVAALAAGEGGVSGGLDRAGDELTAAGPGPPPSSPERLTSLESERWAWWREAGGAVADEPVLGWGAGAFRSAAACTGSPRTPPSTRTASPSPGSPTSAGSAPASVCWPSCSSSRGRSRGPSRCRPAASATSAARCSRPAVTFLAHTLVDRTWTVPGVALLALVLLGVAGGRAPGPRPLLLEQAAGRASAGRLLALGAVVVALAAVVVSAVLPAWSLARSDRALAAPRDPAALEDAAKDAAFAARIDPTAVHPKLAQAAVAERRGRLLEARRYLLEAVDRQPASVTAWTRLSAVAQRLADREGARRAILRAVALDPADPALERRARGVEAATTPPEASATATGTPLPPPPSRRPPSPARCPGRTRRRPSPGPRSRRPAPRRRRRGPSRAAGSRRARGSARARPRRARRTRRRRRRRTGRPRARAGRRPPGARGRPRAAAGAGASRRGPGRPSRSRSRRAPPRSRDPARRPGRRARSPRTGRAGRAAPRRAAAAPARRRAGPAPRRTGAPRPAGRPRAPGP
jgi:hypothetical protein